MYDQEKIMPLIRRWNQEPWSQKFWPLKTEWEGKFADNKVGSSRKKVFEWLQDVDVLEINIVRDPDDDCDDWFEDLLDNYRGCEFVQRGGDSGVMNSLEWLAANPLNFDNMLIGKYRDIDKLVAEIEARKKGYKPIDTLCDPKNYVNGDISSGKLRPRVAKKVQASIDKWGKRPK